jgi:ATP-dependent DNA helicase RecG
MEQLDLDFEAPLPSLPQLWTPDDIFTHLDNATVQRFKEDGRLERKRARIAQRDLAEYFSMWANTQPNGGIILLGVENDGAISGCSSLSDNQLNEIERTSRLCPDARCAFKRIAVTNARDKPDFLVAIRVSYREDKLVETTAGDAFIREGEDKRRLTELEKREIRLNKGQLDVEREKVTLKYPEDFDIKLIALFHEQYVAKRRLTQKFTLEEVLELTKLGKNNKSSFEPNVACALLFAKDVRQELPGAFIRVIRYDGTEERFGQRLNIVSDKIVEGPLPLQIAEAEKLISLQMRNFTRLGRDGRFETKPEYPRDVWLEAVINAAVHRSYNLRHMNIFVKLFDDKFVVESPGAFMREAVHRLSATKNHQTN